MNMWARALEIAKRTPEERNRYVDLLRALSILAVVLGHWIMAAPSFHSDSAQMQHLLDIQPWSRWLTWIFQVMPIFFFVGGFSNGASWDSALRKDIGYGQWLDARLRRLLGPAIPLVMLWTGLAMVGWAFGVHHDFIRIGSQVSLVPVWFLAIYFVIVALVPITRKLWFRVGWWSIFVPVIFAVVGDLVFFNTPYTWFGWFNYLFIWGAVHQLGYAWQQGRLSGSHKAAVGAIVGFVALILMTKFGPYPLSLVGVPSEELSNTTPPKLPLLALAMAQVGIVLLLETRARKWLSGMQTWAATVMINGFIMPVFLWHSTVMMLMIGATFWLLPALLVIVPGTTEWWEMRPIWVSAYLLVMITLLPAFIWSEKSVSVGQRKPTILLTTLLGALAVCLGLAMLAVGGVAGKSWLGINWLACVLPPLGLLIATLGSKRIS